MPVTPNKDLKTHRGLSVSLAQLINGSLLGCDIHLPEGDTSVGCYSHDFRGILQEVTLERLFQANFTSTDPILNDKSLSTSEKFEQIMQQVQELYWS